MKSSTQPISLTYLKGKTRVSETPKGCYKVPDWGQELGVVENVVLEDCKEYRNKELEKHNGGRC